MFYRVLYYGNPHRLFLSYLFRMQVLDDAPVLYMMNNELYLLTLCTLTVFIGICLNTTISFTLLAFIVVTFLYLNAYTLPLTTVIELTLLLFVLYSFTILYLNRTSINPLLSVFNIKTFPQ